MNKSEEPIEIVNDKIRKLKSREIRELGISYKDFMIDSEEYRISIPPKPVGYWCIGESYKIAMYKKPRITTRFFMNLFFEIKWEDHSS